jgi:hypothetical protein
MHQEESRHRRELLRGPPHSQRPEGGGGGPGGALAGARGGDMRPRGGGGGLVFPEAGQEMLGAALGGPVGGMAWEARAPRTGLCGHVCAPRASTR